MNPIEPIYKKQLKKLEREHPGALVIFMNMMGVYLYVSSACHDVLGYEPKEVIGHNALEFAAVEDIPHVEIALKDALLNDESVMVNIRVKTKSGELKAARGAAYRVIDHETDRTYLMGWVELI